MTEREILIEELLFGKNHKYKVCTRFHVDERGEYWLVGKGISYRVIEFDNYGRIVRVTNNQKKRKSRKEEKHLAS